MPITGDAGSSTDSGTGAGTGTSAATAAAAKAKKHKATPTIIAAPTVTLGGLIASAKAAQSGTVQATTSSGITARAAGTLSVAEIIAQAAYTMVAQAGDQSDSTRSLLNYA